jgi:hypothetical protein
MCIKKLITCAMFTVLIGAIFPVAVLAQPGTLLATVNTPVLSPSGIGIGIAVDCQDPANIYYTHSYSDSLHTMDKNGNVVGVPVAMTDAASGAAISFGAISWDESRQRLWGGTDASGNPLSVYLIDPVSGLCTYIFTLMAAGCCGFCDGIAFDGTDNSIWVSDDVDCDVEHWDVSAVDAAGVGPAVHIGTITPTDAAGVPLCAISGCAVGKGDRLYLGRNGLAKITAVTKAGAFISDFATATGRDEGLACDVVSFAPKEVLWSKDAYADYAEVFEVEDETCVCPGEEGLVVDLDIKPQSCPNPLNVVSSPHAWVNEDLDVVAAKMAPSGPQSFKAVIPVAILGNDVDVYDIDPSTVELEGVSPVRFNYVDVATPVDDDAEECECTTLGSDGFIDLTLKFNRADIIDALGPVNDGDVIVLALTGELYDGTPFTGNDCVIIRARGGPAAAAEGSDPRVLALANYPNPFNPATEISFSLPAASHVRLEVYNITGQKVTTLVDRFMETGAHSVAWNSTDESGARVSSGVYLYRLSAGDLVETRKMMLLK